MKDQSSDSLMSNIKAPTDINSQVNSYKDLEIERSQKKRKRYLLIASIIAIILLLFLFSIVLYFIFITIKKNSNSQGNSNSQTDYEFLYINDIHLDPLYVSDSTPSNCRQSSGTGIHYPFGQYGCDSPESTFLSMINFLPKASTNPKFILFGGLCSKLWEK